MHNHPNLVNIASVVGNAARAVMLTTLMAGEALTATELAGQANVTKQTASSHLGKLMEAGLIVVASQGRHRYFKLADQDVAHLLESLMGVAHRTGATKFRLGPRDPQLRKARVCYDHLAGEMGVMIYDLFLKQGYIRSITTTPNHSPDIVLTRKGRKFCTELEIDFEQKPKSRRPLCRPCLDWSARRFHLAGSLGVGILNYCYQQKLAKRIEGSRVVKFTAKGGYTFKQVFQISP